MRMLPQMATTMPMKEDQRFRLSSEVEVEVEKSMVWTVVMVVVVVRAAQSCSGDVGGRAAARFSLSM